MLKSMLSEAHFISTAHLILPTIRMGLNSITYGKWRGVGEQSAQFSWNRAERRFIFALCWSSALTEQNGKLTVIKIFRFPHGMIGRRVRGGDSRIGHHIYRMHHVK